MAAKTRVVVQKKREGVYYRCDLKKIVAVGMEHLRFAEASR